MWQWLTLVQLAAPGGAPSAALKLLPPACARSAGDEILVCRSKEASPRYGPRLAEPDPRILPDAEFRLFGRARLRAAGEQRSVGGFTAPAAMVSVKLPF